MKRLMQNKADAIVMVLFTTLIWVWLLPETILIRNLCIFIGGITSLFIIWRSRYLINKEHFATAALLSSIFIWTFIHFLYFSKNKDLQFLELLSIWKRAIFSCILGAGVGYICTNTNNLNDKKILSMFSIALCGPAFIYIIKLFSSNAFINAPEWLRLYSSSAPYYIPKVGYVSFLLPAISFSLTALILNNSSKVLPKGFVFTLTIGLILSFSVFLLENIRNGIIWSMLLVFIYFWPRFKKLPLPIKTTILAILISLIYLKVNTVLNFLSDVYLGSKIEELDHWKHTGEKWYPINSYGNVASSSTYDRTAWFFSGLYLLSRNLAGYGLVQNSFGYLSAIEWPDSKLHQTHSGILDLALGIGFPGVLLIILSGVLIVRYLSKTWGGVLTCKSIFLKSISVTLAMLLMVWTTSELSQKVFLEYTILWLGIGFGSMIQRSTRIYPLN